MKDKIRICDMCLKKFGRYEFMSYITGEIRLGLCCYKCTQKILKENKEGK